MTEDKFKFKDIKGLLRETYKEWQDDEPFRLSAVVSYFAIISLPGLLVIVVQIASVIFGEAAVKGEIVEQVSHSLGRDTASNIQKMIANASESEDSTLANIFGIGTLIFGATGVFYQL